MLPDKTRHDAAAACPARYLSHLEQLPQLSPEERAPLEAVAARFPLRLNENYAHLIDWDNPHDPIRRLVIPCADELDAAGALDPCNEAGVTVAPGVQHKYPHTVLLLCSQVCAGQCRYCFRKRLFMDEVHEPACDIAAGLAYIAARPQITNVLLTGGDPLLLSTRRLGEILEGLRRIEHVRIIRIGSKLPAFDPQRLLRNTELFELLARHSQPRQRIYLMAHFDHPRELTDDAVRVIDAFIRAGVICVNQCPLVRGINDNSETLAELFTELSFIGCPPYYVFQCRPTTGNATYAVPIVRGWQVFRAALRFGSGLASRARFVMSHATGKIEVLAVDARRIYLRYHRARVAADRGRFMIYRRDDNACWLDDLKPAHAGEAAVLRPVPLRDASRARKGA